MHALRGWTVTAFLLDFVAFWISLKDDREKQRWFIVLITCQYLEGLKTLDMYKKL